jgi:ferredoxin
MMTIKLKDPSGNWHTFTGDAKTSITEQCEKLGIDSPFACRAGACTTCACHVRTGAEHLIQNRFGEKLIDTDEDQFLSCI